MGGRHPGPGRRPAGAPQGGFTLVEMLVALVVFSIGMLGLAGLQATGLRNNLSAYHRSQATVLAYDIVDRMRANRSVALANGYDLSLAADPSSGTVAGDDLLAWRARLAAELPEGTGGVDCATANPICTVTLQWEDERGSGDEEQFLVSAEP